MTLPDITEAMIGAAVGGDLGALAELLVACEPPLRGRLRGRIGPLYQSVLTEDDVIQVTFIEAHLGISQLAARSGEACLAWLKRIADNNLRDALRAIDSTDRPPPRNRITRPSSADSSDSYMALLGVLAASDTSPSRGASRQEIAEIVEQALSELPPDYAKAVRLYDLEGRAISDVASQLNRSAGATHMLRARAHDRLRQLLGDTAQFFDEE